MPPQSHLLFAVFDLDGAPGPVLAALGRAILAVTAEGTELLAGFPAEDLTVTVGVGPALVRSVDSELPAAAEVPAYPREKLAARASAGDVMIQVGASSPLLPRLGLTAVLAQLASSVGDRLSARWEQAAVRGQHITITADVYAPRNILGYVDGIAGPRTEAQFDENIWLQGNDRVSGGTVLCVRRMNIDTAAFSRLSPQARDAVIGRTPAGVPLSGGAVSADVDLWAKHPDGEYVVPVASHARRSHALATGVGLMFRRSYTMVDPEPGLLFVSLQNSLDTFTKTMDRMSESDDLLALTTTTAVGSFLVLPGFDVDRPLGSTLWPA